MATRAACYDVPKFHERLWREFAGSATEVPEVVKAGDAKVAGFGDGFVPEMFHRFYADRPREIPGPEREAAAAVRARLHSLASELPEVETLRKRTLHNDLWSGMAATEIAERVAEALPKRRTPPPDPDAAARVLRGMQSLVRRDPSKVDELAGELAEAEGRVRGASFKAAEEAEGIDESALRTAMREGIEAAHEAIDEARAAIETFGGSGAGYGGERTGGMTPAVAIELARKVASSDKLRRIIELAGRLMATGRAKRATRTDFARSEIVGVEPVGDFADLVPGELVNLAHPLTAADLASRVIEHGALGYELKGTERMKRGPIVVGLDVSGSMGGDKDVWSKAIALALLDAARKDGRPFGVVLFDGKVVDSYYCPKPEACDPAALLRIMLNEASGGCDFDLPINPVLDMIEKAPALGRADGILVTDACIGESHNRKAPAAMARADKAGAHLFGVIIGSDDGTLARWSHEAVAISDVREDSKAVDLIFDGVLP